SRDDDPLSSTQSGQKVGEGLARTRACFHDQMLAFLQAALDCTSHLKLPTPELVGERGTRQHAPGGKEIVQRRQRLSGDGSSRQGESPVKTLSLYGRFPV